MARADESCPARLRPGCELSPSTLGEVCHDQPGRGRTLRAEHRAHPGPHRATKLREHSGKFTPNTAALPEAILRTILKEPRVLGLAEQGRLTVKDYMDQCARHVDVSEGTIRRVFTKLVERGELLAWRPPRLHGSIGYGLAPRHARAAEEGQPRKAMTAPGDVTPTGL
jgi:hypothetical protein